MTWHLLNRLLAAIYPTRCPLCSQFVESKDRPCQDCLSSIQFLEGDANLILLKKKWFERCRSRFAYDGRIRDVLHEFKYVGHLDLVRYLGNELASEAGKFGDVDLLVPVPLHKKRIRSRGFNQSALIARHIGNKLGTLVLPDALMRIEDADAQVGLEREERLANVKGIFAIDTKKGAQIQGKNILLIDDVVTTGATVNECSRVLMKAGANSVSVLSIARTL